VRNHFSLSTSTRVAEGTLAPVSPARALGRGFPDRPKGVPADYLTQLIPTSTGQQLVGALADPFRTIPS